MPRGLIDWRDIRRTAIPEEPHKPYPRWRRLLTWGSVIMAAAAWVMFIVFHIFHRPADSMLWIPTAGWPLYYGLVFAMGRALLSKQVPRSASARILGANIPLPPRSIVEAFYRASGSLILVMFPLIAMLMGVGMMVALA